MENNDDLNFLYTSGSVETCDEMLANWYDTAKSHMRKVKSVKNFAMAIYFFEMIESISPNYKDCAKNIEKCKEKMVVAEHYHEEKEHQHAENEKQEKIKQQKQQKRNKIKRVFKSPYLYVLLAIVTIIVIILAYSMAFAISV